MSRVWSPVMIHHTSLLLCMMWSCGFIKPWFPAHTAERCVWIKSSWNEVLHAWGRGSQLQKVGLSVLGWRFLLHAEEFRCLSLVHEQGKVEWKTERWIVASGLWSAEVRRKWIMKPWRPSWRFTFTPLPLGKLWVATNTIWSQLRAGETVWAQTIQKGCRVEIL